MPEIVLNMYPLSAPLPCFKCRKELEPVDPAFGFRASGQPYEGVMCSTGGNYGSRVFDSMGRDSLYFNICDECLLANRDLLIWMRTIPQSPTYEYIVSDPFEGVEQADLDGDDN